jgi:hypothetical protein
MRTPSSQATTPCRTPLTQHATVGIEKLGVQSNEHLMARTLTLGRATGNFCLWLFAAATSV